MVENLNISFIIQVAIYHIIRNLHQIKFLQIIISTKFNFQKYYKEYRKYDNYFQRL